MEPHNYNVAVRWNKERKGVMCSPDLSENPQSCIEVATPPEFPKGIPGIWSPEHLFTASVSSCFMTTFLAIAENSKLEFTEFTCVAEGKLEQIENKLLMTSVLLKPTVIVPNEHVRERALKVLEKTEKNCLITNSIKSEVVMKPTVKVLQTA